MYRFLVWSQYCVLLMMINFILVTITFHRAWYQRTHTHTQKYINYLHSLWYQHVALSLYFWCFQVFAIIEIHAQQYTCTCKPIQIPSLINDNYHYTNTNVDKSIYEKVSEDIYLKCQLRSQTMDILRLWVLNSLTSAHISGIYTCICRYRS